MEFNFHCVAFFPPDSSIELSANLGSVFSTVTFRNYTLIGCLTPETAKTPTVQLSNGILSLVFDSSTYLKTCDSIHFSGTLDGIQFALPARADIPWTFSIKTIDINSGLVVTGCLANDPGTMTEIFPAQLPVTATALSPDVKHSLSVLSFILAPPPQIQTTDHVIVDLDCLLHTDLTDANIAGADMFLETDPVTNRRSRLRIARTSSSSPATSLTINVYQLMVFCPSASTASAKITLRGSAPSAYVRQETTLYFPLAEYVPVIGFEFSPPDWLTPAPFVITLTLPYMLDAYFTLTIPPNLLFGRNYEDLPSIEFMVVDKFQNQVTMPFAITDTMYTYGMPQPGSDLPVPAYVRFRTRTNAPNAHGKPFSAHPEYEYKLKVILRNARRSAVILTRTYVGHITIAGEKETDSNIVIPLSVSFNEDASASALQPLVPTLTVLDQPSGPLVMRERLTLTLRFRSPVDFKFGDKILMGGWELGLSDTTIVRLYANQTWALAGNVYEIGDTGNVLFRVSVIAINSGWSPPDVLPADQRRVIDFRITWNVPPSWQNLVFQVEDSLNTLMPRTWSGTLLPTGLPTIVDASSKVNVFTITTPHGFYANTGYTNVVHVHFRVTGLSLLTDDVIFIYMLEAHASVSQGAAVPFEVIGGGHLRLSACVYAINGRYSTRGVECFVDATSSPTRSIENPAAIIVLSNILAPVLPDDPGVPSSAQMRLMISPKLNKQLYFVDVASPLSIKTLPTASLTDPASVPIVYTWDGDLHSRRLHAAANLPFAGSSNPFLNADSRYVGCPVVR